MRPRILMVTPEFPPRWGGIGTHCYELARHWAERAEVTVLAPAGSRCPDRAFRVVALPPVRGPVGRAVATFRAVSGLLAEDRFDLAYVLHWRTSGVAYRLAAVPRRRRPRYVQAIHGGEVLYLLRGGARAAVDRWLFRRTVSGAARLAALGQHQVGLLERLEIGRERVFVSPEGVDLDAFDLVPEDERPATLRGQLGLRDARVLLTVARLVPHKGHDMVIRALPRILERVPDAAYLIVGSGPNERHLRQLAGELGVAERVRFAGSVSDQDLVACYHLCDVFVMPSREEGGNVEGFGIVFAEAAACARPVIGGRTGGIVEVVRDGETGLLVDPRSPEEIAGAAVRLLTDVELARRLGAAGRSRMATEFQYGGIAERMLAACGVATAPLETAR